MVAFVLNIENDLWGLVLKRNIIQKGYCPYACLNIDSKLLFFGDDRHDCNHIQPKTCWMCIEHLLVNYRRPCGFEVAIQNWSKSPHRQKNMSIQGMMSSLLFGMGFYANRIMMSIQSKWHFVATADKTYIKQDCYPTWLLVILWWKKACSCFPLRQNAPVNGYGYVQVRSNAHVSRYTFWGASSMRITAVVSVDLTSVFVGYLMLFVQSSYSTQNGFKLHTLHHMTWCFNTWPTREGTVIFATRVGHTQANAGIFDMYSTNMAFYFSVYPTKHATCHICL